MFVCVLYGVKSVRNVLFSSLTAEKRTWKKCDAPENIGKVRT